MKLPSSGQVTGLAGTLVGAAAIAGVIAQIELSGQPHANIWSNAWLLAAVVLAGIALVVVTVYSVASILTRGESKPVDVGIGDVPPASQIDEVSQQGPVTSKAADQAREASGLRTGPAFTGQWRHTSDGFEASPLMRMANLSMPGFMSVRGQSPQIRIGACVACDPIPSGASSSVFGANLMEFLRRDPVASLINSAINTDDGLTWTRQAGNGVLSLEAVLSLSDGEPVASALLQPPVTGMQLYGRDEGVACFWLHIDPRGTGGSAAPKTGLAGWYQRFLLAIAVAGAFADFVARDLGLQTFNEPPVRAGVMIETVGPLSDLVDTGNLSPLPGAIPATQFLSYAIADPGGDTAERPALDMLKQLCDHSLHLGDFENALEMVHHDYLAAAHAASSQPSAYHPQALQSTWERRELPVLRAVVKLLDQPGSFEATVSQISDETGIDKADVDRAIEALKGEYITEYQQFLSGGDPSTWAVRGITPKARRAVGQWPDE